VTIYNPSSSNRKDYVNNVEKQLFSETVDIIGVSAVLTIM